jgi:hypothetical protein
MCGTKTGTARRRDNAEEQRAKKTDTSFRDYNTWKSVTLLANLPMTHKEEEKTLGFVDKR